MLIGLHHHKKMNTTNALPRALPPPLVCSVARTTYLQESRAEKLYFVARKVRHSVFPFMHQLFNPAVPYTTPDQRRLIRPPPYTNH